MIYQDDETRKINDEMNEETRILDQPENPAAPVSKEAMSGTPWAARIGLSVAGLAGAAGVAMAASSGSSSAEKSSTLAVAATPDPDDTSDATSADSDIDDPYDLPASNSVPKTSTTSSSSSSNSTESTESTVSATTAAASSDNDSETADSVTVEDSDFSDDGEVQEEIIIDSNNDNDIVPNQSDVILQNEAGIQYAHVDDSMSFGEAFAAARQQVGAPGVFTWHGNVYGTYYQEEWNNMSQAERADYLHAIQFPDEYNNDVAVTNVVPEPDHQIEIHNVSQVMDGSGDISTTAHITIDGVETYFVDLDGDGTIDTVHVDLDGDGNFSPADDAMISVHDLDLTVDDIVEAIQQQNDLLGGDDLASIDFDPSANADF